MTRQRYPPWTCKDVGWLLRAKGRHGSCPIEEEMIVTMFLTVCPGWSVIRLEMWQVTRGRMGVEAWKACRFQGGLLSSHVASWSKAQVICWEWEAGRNVLRVCDILRTWPGSPFMWMWVAQGGEVRGRWGTPQQPSAEWLKIWFMHHHGQKSNKRVPVPLTS
jgi:hypothetical protein